jgi:hypothetical protein
MPIRTQLQTFWWFRGKQIGGMAQPGFNALAPSPLALDESLARSFLAKLTQSRFSMASFDAFLAWWRTSVVPEFGLDAAAFEAAAARLADPSELLDTLGRLEQKMGFPQRAATFEERGDAGIEVELPDQRIRLELDILEEHGFATLVSLLEAPPHSTVAASGLEVHHLPVDDTTPPTNDQVLAFADVLEDVYANDKRLVVHCMAGVGRTSTMLMAGHMLRGETLPDLRRELGTTNPGYQFRGKQTVFLNRLAGDLEST